jgi:hypothetical protein
LVLTRVRVVPYKVDAELCVTPVISIVLSSSDLVSVPWVAGLSFSDAVPVKGDDVIVANVEVREMEEVIVVGAVEVVVVVVVAEEDSMVVVVAEEEDSVVIVVAEEEDSVVIAAWFVVRFAALHVMFVSMSS